MNFFYNPMIEMSLKNVSTRPNSTYWTSPIQQLFKMPLKRISESFKVGVFFNIIKNLNIFLEVIIKYLKSLEYF